MRQLLMIPMLLFVLAPGAASAAPRSGVYSNVCLYPETDDLGGIELSLDLNARPISVRLIECAGGCWKHPTGDVRLKADELTFTAKDESFSSNGKIVESVTHRFTAAFGKRSVKLTSDDPGLSPQSLFKSRQNSEDHEASATTPVRRCRK